MWFEVCVAWVHLPMVLSMVGVVAPVLGWPLSSLSVMVDVEGEREKALKGPKCVSLSSKVNRLASRLIK
jgi:hypothetical protein